MIITGEQIAERDRWERLLMEQKVNLFDGLYMMLSSGAPATPYLMQRLTAADIAYKEGGISDLAEAFGMALTQSEKRSLNDENLRNHIKRLVEEEAAKGHPLLNPNQHTDKVSAFTQVANILSKKTEDGLDTQPRLSVSTIFDIFYDRDFKGRKNKS